MQKRNVGVDESVINDRFNQLRKKLRVRSCTFRTHTARAATHESQILRQNLASR